MKIDEIVMLELTNIDKIYLIKQGNFYRAYNKSAMFFESIFYSYKIQIKCIKKIKSDIYFLGFPLGNIEKIESVCIANNYSITYNKDEVSSVKVITGFATDIFKYDDWIQKKMMKRLYNISDKTIDFQQKILLKKIMKYPLENKTPFEAFEFLYQLKEKLNSLDKTI